MKLSKMNNSKGNAHQQADLLREMSQFTKEMELKMLRIQGKIDGNIESLKDKQLKLEFNFDAPPMSKILSKAISKEVRNIIRESILFIVEITQGIVKE